MCLSSHEDATSLVTVSEGKYYSLGLDLVATGTSGMGLTQYIFSVQKMYRRLLTFPLVTVAAANGIWSPSFSLTSSHALNSSLCRSYLWSWSSLWSLSRLHHHEQ